jgi:hypothetical protein
MLCAIVSFLPFVIQHIPAKNALILILLLRIFLNILTCPKKNQASHVYLLFGNYISGAHLSRDFCMEKP